MALTLVIAACGGNDAVQIEDAWARTSANMQNGGAVYLTISGGADGDRLVGVSVDDSIAQMAQLHQMTVTEADEPQVTYGPFAWDYRLMIAPITGGLRL
jgi:copper(I)-binding protein